MAIGTTAALAACGGGGGDGLGLDVGSAAGSGGSAINAANSTVVASQAFLASGELNTQTSDSGGGLVQASIKQMDKALGIAFLNRANGLTNTLVVNCAQGGTATITLDAASTQQVSSGDSVLVSADNCVDGTDSANGAIRIDFTEVTGRPSSTSAWNGTMTVSFTDFTFDDGNESNTANGGMTLTYDQTAARTATFSLAGNSLRVQTTEDGTTAERELSAFNTSGSVNGDLLTYRTGFTLSGDLPQLGESESPFTVNTLTDFTQQENSNPSQGALQVTAGDGSSLTLTTLDTTNVNIAVDSDGDGTAEQNTTTTWDALADAI